MKKHNKMKVIINGNIYSGNDTPIAIVFNSDMERHVIGNHILNMENKEGVRVYAVYPEGFEKIEEHFDNIKKIATE